MTAPYKSLYTIFTEQQMRRDNIIAAQKLYSIFADKTNANILQNRIEKITKHEIEAVNKCIKSMRRTSNG
jgi:hypothetical protein